MTVTRTAAVAMRIDSHMNVVGGTVTRTAAVAMRIDSHMNVVGGVGRVRVIVTVQLHCKGLHWADSDTQ